MLGIKEEWLRLLLRELDRMTQSKLGSPTVRALLRVACPPHATHATRAMLRQGSPAP